jgi:hypothetical protein
MARLTMQVSRVPSSQLPRDRMTNVLHFDTEDPVGAPDHAALATDLLAIYDQHLAPLTGFTGWECRVYDKADDKPRQPKATVTRPQRTGPAAPAPYEVALCLSFYSERNIPRRRGRIYLGPLTAGNANSERPSAGLLTLALDMATAFSALGGANVTWQVYSPTTDDTMPVTNAWCDDAWDTQRRRGLKPASRQTRAVSG